MLKASGILIILGGIVGGIYFGLQVAVSGLTIMIDSAKATPTDGWGVLQGLIMFFPLSVIVFLVVSKLGLMIGETMLDVKVDKSSPSLFNWR